MNPAKVQRTLTRMLASRIVRAQRGVSAPAGSYLSAEIGALREALGSMGLLDEQEVSATVTRIEHEWKARKTA